VINNAHFSKTSDVYAFGIILWELFTRQEIYEGLSAAQIIAKVRISSYFLKCDILMFGLL
jgi:hypothetical protein